MFLRKGFCFSLLFVFLFFFSPKNIHAAGTVVVNDFPDQVQIMQEFSVDFSATELEADTLYYAKGRIGNSASGLSEGQTLNGSSWLNDTGDSWSSFPSFTTNSSGNLSGTINLRVKESAIVGNGFLLVRIIKGSGQTPYDSDPSSAQFTILAAPSPTPTPIPAPTNTIVPTQTVQDAVYKINKSKDGSGAELTSVKIYVDNAYIGHEDNEILTFCDGCHCDNPKNVDCGFGQHTIKLQKDGYSDWSEIKTFDSGNTFEVNPVLSKISPTSTNTPAPTSTLVPSSTPKLTTTPKPTLGSSIILATSSAEEVLGTNNQNQQFIEETNNLRGESLSDISTPEAKGNFDILPILFIVPGILMIGFAVFMFFKSKRRATP